MLGLFLNPGFLFIAGALISVPIIIHLINRMRFKRIRWAAMEFLLKAQKRTRKRLIIEQLLLLALRCLLIGLVGLLVSRFIGCGDANLGGKPNLHYALIDDTLSMQDQWKQPDGSYKNCFDVAKNDILIKKIAKGLSQSKTNDRLIILPLSKIDDPEYQQKMYENLSDPQRLKELTQDITDMQPSMRHVSMLDGVKQARKAVGNNPDSRMTLHLLTDFRDKEWSLPAGEALTKELLDLVKQNKDMKVRPIDTVHPVRAGQVGYPDSRDNVGILDVRPSTRIVGKNMPVQFTVTIKNFGGKEIYASLSAWDEVTGKDMFEVNFNPSNPVKLKPLDVTTVTFEKRFNPDIKANESHFAHLTVRLTNAQKQPLDNDGLVPDNLRHAVVEVREKVPILVIDGDPKGREEGKDSFHISRSLISVPGASYQIVYGDELPGSSGDATKALERADLNQYPTIFLLNVPSLKPKQVANLENYVKEGGGVAFYLGALVSATAYNKTLYKDGKGVFPAPLKELYFPGPNVPPLEAKETDSSYQLLVREEKFPEHGTPIFGPMFEDPKQKDPLRNLPIGRYFQVARNLWKQEPGRVFELATMPNETPILAFQETVIGITRGDNVKGIQADPQFAKYKTRLAQHLSEIEALVRPGSEAKAYHLATRIDQLLNDKGSLQQKELSPDMTEFWVNSDPRVQTLNRELTGLREQVSFGDPFVVAQTFGKGKVVAIMSTAGKDWNQWAGGSVASVLYPMFVWEMQNYLSSQGSEANLTVGTKVELEIDADQFKGAQLKLVRHFMKIQDDKPAERIKLGEDSLKEVNGKIPFSVTKTLQPGLYLSELVDENAAGKPPIAVYAHVFNVDTANEGDLKRIGSEELFRELVAKAPDQIEIVAAGANEEKLLGRFNDFSESPWLFLILLFVLVAEQALAVHLSFHMRSGDNDALSAKAA